MQDNYIYCIGLMSGTSLDGIDLAYIKMHENLYEDFRIIQAETVSYSNEWKKKLQEAINYDEKDLQILDVDYGEFLGSILNNFIREHRISKLNFIASHGHTVLHQPENGITLQIGNGQVIANVTQQKVVCDFRTQDVTLGGQGAPLVPIGDRLLFTDYDYCLNLGGFANISYEENKQRIAFDICPVNIVLNHYTRKIDLEYDNEGEIASEGKINMGLLRRLNELSFYQDIPPKSLGLEWVQSTIFPLIDNEEADISTILRTFVEHVAMQIGNVVKNDATILVTGGGAFNTFLIKRIEFFAQTKIKQVSTELTDYKEALIFALLGVLKTQNKVNCLQSVTGAKKDHSSGNIFYPQK
ncbi:anhydro-N-acetylmuramic acid kinase [Tenacibaculum sp. KUL118]|uniref:anhydro-N-acetylmuramic acid kinase n=1 Tax=Tenacibaculum sp. XPcli2-G TaxID=2954503 RepID=UPI0012E4F592|nr:anhydro-N-acetylmuramic acid kinase [Tenacibaculum sp. XPcli2-G]MCO7186322.1 anhydro-N-acetylmuramic acid kinase [Tenacibaculum sp. XPcli2-G]BFF40004.1 anhydro-N-acetylmuramic acid kinase [Tenacibaculum mesophilum]GFD83393.1 anhydro-N-acetylmuramic acid kinase [Tenacibaculum sp. KUL118]